jgi:hypothetical protein
MGSGRLSHKLVKKPYFDVIRTIRSRLETGNELHGHTSPSTTTLSGTTLAVVGVPEVFGEAAPAFRDEDAQPTKLKINPQKITHKVRVGDRVRLDSEVISFSKMASTRPLQIPHVRSRGIQAKYEYLAIGIHCPEEGAASVIHQPE